MGSCCTPISVSDIFTRRSTNGDSPLRADGTLSHDVSSIGVLMDALRRCRIPDEEPPLSISWEAIDHVSAAPDEQQPIGWAPMETGTVLTAEPGLI